MERILFIIFALLLAIPVPAQKNRSVSLNYQHLRDAGNHGVGIGFKTNLFGKITLLTDAYYFFNHYNGDFQENHQKEYNAQYYTINANLGYHFALFDKFSIFPYVGVGILHEFIHGYMSGKGTPPSLGDPPGTGAPYHVSIDDNTLVPLVNFGLSAEYDLSNNIFLTAGAKYMLDIDNSTYNDFPNLTAGIGYKF